MNVFFTNHPFFRHMKEVIAVSGVLVFGIAILKNDIFLSRYLSDAVRAPSEWSHDIPPGRPFVMLSSILKNVPIAGYYTDTYGPDFWYTSSALVEYQRAQAALAPTILDAEDPFRHDWVILVCSQGGCERGLMQKRDLVFVTRIDGRITLGHRKKGGGE